MIGTVLLSLSLSGSILALAVLLCGNLLGARLGKTWVYYLWLLVALRLLLPVALPVNLVGPLFAAGVPKIAAEHTESRAEPAWETAVTAAPAAPAHTEETSASALPFDAFHWETVWAAAALVLFVRKVSDYQSYLRFLRAGARPAGEQAREACVRACVRLKIRKTPEVLVNPMLTSPMLAGFFHPFVVLPSEDCGDVSLVLLHELLHWRRLDAVWKWTAQLAVCIHWFNPLAYLMRRELERTCELSCDEAVLRILDAGERRGYGDTLLEAARLGGKYGGAVISLGADASLLKERLRAIMEFHGRTAGQRFCSLLAGGLLTVLALVCGCAVLADTAQPARKSTLPLPPREAPAAAERVTASQSEKSGGEDDFAGDELSESFSFKDASGWRYISRSFFENGYILQIEWDKREDKLFNGVERQVAVNGQTRSLLLDGQAAEYAGEAAVLKAAALALEEMEESDGKYASAFSSVTPRLTRVEGPYRQSAGELAQTFYAKKDIMRLGAVVPKADQKTQEALAKRAYADNDVAAFSILYDLGFSAEQCKQLARQAYEDSRVALFSMLLDSLGRTEQKALAKQAYQDGRVAEFSMLLDSLDRTEQKALAKQAYRDGKVAEFSMLLDSLDRTEQKALAKQAYRDGKVAQFSILADSLDKAEQKALAEQARRDGKIAFLSILSSSADDYGWDWDEDGDSWNWEQDFRDEDWDNMDWKNMLG